MAAAPRNDPTVSHVRMSDYGYWVAEVNIAPGRTMSVMIAVTGVSSEQVPGLALSVLTGKIRGISS